MKRPLTLFIGIILSIIILSVIYPSDPGKTSIIDRITMRSNSVTLTPVNQQHNYAIADIKKLDSEGTALAWSPDGKRIYYAKNVEGAKDGEEELWVCDTGSTGAKIDSVIKMYNLGNARWSPDGKKLAFMSGSFESFTRLLVLDTDSGEILDITPDKASDAGVTSYDWDKESVEVIMTTNIVSPKIEIYSFLTNKFRKLDLDLKYCSNAAFFADNGIVFSDVDQSGVYKIYNADRYGRGAYPLAEGQNFIVSADRCRIAILSDGNTQSGLWVYDNITKKTKTIRYQPIYSVYWLSNNGMLYSTEEDCTDDSTYHGLIYCLDQDMNSTTVEDAVYPIFVPDQKGDMVAMTVPYMIGGDNKDMGVYIGKLKK